MGKARATLLASVVCGLLAGACDDLDPQTGELTPACVDVDSDPARKVSFKNDIRPIMSGLVAGTKGCKPCHYPTNLAGTREGFLQTGLNLEALEYIRRGGRNTPPTSILVPGKPCSSAIVKKLQGTFGNARMPKGGPYWDPTKIQLMRDWIFEGAEGADDD